MASIIIYNPNDKVVPNRVITYKERAHTPDYLNQENVLINYDVSKLSEIEWKYWKYEEPEIVGMSDIEKEAIDILALTPALKTRMDILNEVFSAATQNYEDPGQIDRLINGLNKHPIFAFTLDDYSYDFAYSLAMNIYIAGDITEEDLMLVLSALPWSPPE